VAAFKCNRGAGRGIRDLHDEHTHALAVSLAEGARDIIADLKRQIRSGHLTPDRVNALRPRAGLTERLRLRVERAILASYDAGKARAREEVAAASRLAQ
jgi:hypothetical protein